ncbi:MAG: M3 family metallopeptidase [Bacteroidaceae bacterium]|nr:M3 family metallopeptidase [Bacteroidaceae bacterium]
MSIKEFVGEEELNNEEPVNYFLSPYKTPFGSIPFDKIKFEDYEPAFMTGMQLEDEFIASIVENPAIPTFENTILPQTDTVLKLVCDVFFNLLNVHTNDDFDALAQKISPLLSEHSNKVVLNEKLFQRVKYVYNHQHDLNAEETKLLEDVYQGFVRSGACLKPKDKQRLAALKVELSSLVISFDQHELKDLNAFRLHVTDRAQLEGLSDIVLETAQKSASEAQLEGWLFTLHDSCYVPFMAYASNRELRRQMYFAKNTICNQGNENDNNAVVTRIVNIRREIAQILGHECFADFVLEKRMAKNKEAVYKLLDELILTYKPIAQSEMNAVRALAKEMEGEDFQLECWDFAYYSNKLKTKLFDIDAEMLKPYFKLENVKKGVFGLATRLYDISFVRNYQIAVYHPDVEVYEVYDKDGSFLALLYLDFFPRASKQSGAWMTDFMEQYVDEYHIDHRPHVSINMNFSKPSADNISLLTLREIETFLHEFGHALHSIFSKVRFQSLAGTSVYRDFVELPSQFMENYAVQPEFLKSFAFHYQTGEALPVEYIERIVKSRNFQCGYACLRQVSFGLLDMAYYTLTKPFEADVTQFEAEAWQRAQLTSTPDNVCMSVHFGHIMSGGYSAGYYSYKWAEVLDADAFSLFLEKGIFDKETAQSFRDNILSKGGTEHPEELYKKFRGRNPSIHALLRRNNII